MKFKAEKMRLLNLRGSLREQRDAYRTHVESALKKLQAAGEAEQEALRRKMLLHIRAVRVKVLD